ncbi:MAG TPA: hypothetical protein VFK13_15815 [Gemmatimonadaceae bacterium]|nr:hypothetical protein [Gemmatimonadaceae bacterium]
MTRNWGWATVALALLVASPLRAQGYFGKNQVQYDHFDWQVIETEHFLIHYYPAEARAAQDAARMAERAYGRLSRIFNYEFREKKPIILFASRADFGQNNVLGDLGEFTGGVTEAQRHRILLPFTGDYGSFDQVLTHEMTHAFQYDIFAHGRAGEGLQTLAAVNPPLWLFEGAAQYLSIGPVDPYISTIMRDAALNGNLPTARELDERPDRFNPYTFGASFVTFLGQRFGDTTLGAIFNAIPSLGVERAIERETGETLDDLGDEWREAMQAKHLPRVAELERPRKFASALLTERRTGGSVFLAPSLSPDGRTIAFLSNGSFFKGQVFIDLWLADAHTGKRIKRLIKSTTNPNFEELRLLYSQSAFSPDGHRLAFTAQRGGRDVLYILDVDRQKVSDPLDLPLEGVTSPSWSPDGKQLVFTGYHGGISDLYIVNADGTGLRQLTNDVHGDLQPQWSPDGQTIAFATDRSDEADFSVLRYGQLRIALYHLDSGRLEVLPGQAGLNINPMWSPDGQFIAYVSDRNGVQNLYLYALAEQQHYQLTNVVGGVLAATQYSPAITWAHGADRLAFTYYENGEYTVWAIDNPALLRKRPLVEAAPVVAEAPAVDSSDIRPGRSTMDTSVTVATRSLYRDRASGTFRPSETLAADSAAERAPVTVAELLDSASLALPDTSRFLRYPYKVHYSPAFVVRPTISYANENFGNNFFGGTTIVLTDLLGNNQLAFAGAINGRVSEAQVLAEYANLAHRFQYAAGVQQQPYYLGDEFLDGDASNGVLNVAISRNVQRQVFGFGAYPLNRFERFELGARFTSVSRTDEFYSALIQDGLFTTAFRRDSVLHQSTISYMQPYAAYVSDNALFGSVGPIMGHRYRLEVQPAVGRFRWMDYLVDVRKYQPILFNYLTIAARGMASLSVGRDADTLRKSIGNPLILRGYERTTFDRLGSFDTSQCDISSTSLDALARCSPLLGSRVVVANVELRFPILRQGAALGIIGLPPIEGVVFYDAGIAWFSGQHVSFARAATAHDPTQQRNLLTSHGFGIRANLFGIAVLRWDYAVPEDAQVATKGYWRFSLGPSF